MFSVYVPSDFSLKKAVAADLSALPESAVWIDLIKPTAEEDKAVERLAGHPGEGAVQLAAGAHLEGLQSHAQCLGGDLRAFQIAFISRTARAT